LNHDEGRTIVMVVHDLNHAARYAHHVIALCGGQIAAAGTPHDVITPRVVITVFGVEADIVADPVMAPRSVSPTRWLSVANHRGKQRTQMLMIHVWQGLGKAIRA
jgi:iron complex transport system ATP-binding protein